MKYNLISPVHLTSPAVRTEPVTVCQIWIKHSSVFWQVNYQCRVPHAPDELPDGRPRLPAQVWELWVVILCLSVAGRIVWQMVSLSNHRSVTDRVIWLAYIQRPRFEMSYTLLHLMDCKNIKQKKKKTNVSEGPLSAIMGSISRYSFSHSWFIIRFSVFFIYSTWKYNYNKSGRVIVTSEWALCIYRATSLLQSVLVVLLCIYSGQIKHFYFVKTYSGCIVVVSLFVFVTIKSF